MSRNAEGVTGLYRPSRAEVRQVSCPRCGARPGEPCKPNRKNHHGERGRSITDRWGKSQ